MFNRVLKDLRESETLGPVLLAVSVGLIGGFGAIAFRYLILGARISFLDGGAAALPFFGDAYVILLPVVGLVIVSFIVNRWAPEAQGHGVPEVMYAVRKEGGRIRPRVSAIKAIASALCIGSGGSVGREGPIVQIGCTFGSTVGQILGLNEERVRLLVGCGAAAGVAGTFNAPIAGVIFAMEVILGNFTGRAFGLVVISSVTSTAICQGFLGNVPAFDLAQKFALASPWEFPLYLGLGVLAGLIALTFVRTLYFFEDLFEGWKWHYTLKAAIGGLVLGAFIYLAFVLVDRAVGDLPQEKTPEAVTEALAAKEAGRPAEIAPRKPLYLYGVGYDGIEDVLSGTVDVLTILAALVFLKILATSLTLAAGGSGGIFAPSLFIGAMLGGAFGVGVNALFPGITAPPGAYALVGMAAVFSGAAHAPITAIVILFEMTGDYKIILPLMIAAVLSYLIATRLSHDSIYTIKLRRRGGLQPRRPEHSVLDFILVADAMSSHVETTTADTPIAELAPRFHSEHVRAYPVVDKEGKLAGIVSEYDVETTLTEGTAEDRTVGDIMTRRVITCTRDQSLHEVLRRFTEQDVDRIPVVDKEDPKKLLGVLHRKEIFWAYGVMAAEHQRLLDRTGVEPPADAKDSVQVEIEIKPGHGTICQKKVREIPLPEHCLIVMLRRADRAIIPRGKTVVEAGDILVVLTTRANAAELREWVERLGNGNS